MHTLYKKDGTKAVVNDESLTYALSLGWSKNTPKKAPTKKAK